MTDIEQAEAVLAGLIQFKSGDRVMVWDVGKPGPRSENEWEGIVMKRAIELDYFAGSPAVLRHRDQWHVQKISNNSFWFCPESNMERILD